MKVLMIDSLVGNDYALCLCKGLMDAGMQVKLVTVEGRQVNIARFTFPILYMAPPKDKRKSKIKKMFHYIRYLYGLLTVLRRQETQIVHYQFFRRERLDSLFFVLLGFLGVKRVYTAHNVLPHEHGRLDYYLRYAVYQSSNKIIVHSQFIKDKLLKNFSICPQKIEVVPHGNFDLYLPEQKISRLEARDQLNVAANDHLLLFFGYIREYKGIEILLRAFDLARQKNTRLKLIIAGKPHTERLERIYKKQIHRLDLQKKVVFEPRFIPKDEVATYFVAADAIILPYKQIDHSGIVHLAYSFGRPIIATSVGDFSEVIEQGKSGYLVTEKNPMTMAATIQTAFTNRHHLQRMGQYARQLSQSKYSWEDISKKTIQIYQQLS